MTPEQLGGSRSLMPERTRARGYPTVLQARARVWCSAAATANLLLALRRGGEPSLQLTELSRKRNGWSVFTPNGRRQAQGRVTKVLATRTARTNYFYVEEKKENVGAVLVTTANPQPARTPREPGGPPDR